MFPFRLRVSNIVWQISFPRVRRSGIVLDTNSRDISRRRDHEGLNDWIMPGPSNRSAQILGPFGPPKKISTYSKNIKSAYFVF